VVQTDYVGNDPTKETNMSKAEMQLIERIQTILEVDGMTAMAVHEIIEDYFEPDYSEMSHEDYEVTVMAANEMMGELI
jgi:1-aminocyclopropane-1-carboxylate deaminase/D-cysteine desulfhydrase-like pyridoxal-dependent ACC family enzyme